MRALAIHTVNPIDLREGMKSEEIFCPITIREQANKFADGKEFRRPTICIYNGDALLRKDWEITKIQNNDSVMFISVVGGGEDGQKALRNTLLLLAAATVTAVSGGIAGLSIFTGSPILGGFVGGIGAGIVGAIAFWGINELLPPPTEDPVNTPESPSPTYSLNSQGNVARIGEPIPSLYGRHIIYPDLGAIPYTSYQNDDQFLHELLVIGQGHYEIQEIRVDDTSIDNFPEVTKQIITPGEDVTLFNPNVYSSSEINGQELLNENAPQGATFVPGPWIGPFILNPSNTRINKIEYDILAPQGFGSVDNNGNISNRRVRWEFNIRTVDDNGSPVSGWQGVRHNWTNSSDNGIFVIPSIGYVDTYPSGLWGTLEAIRRTYSFAVPFGRYEVRIRRLTQKDDDTSIRDSIYVGGVRGFDPTAVTYPDVTMLALKLRATDSLSRVAARKINVIAQRKLHTWDATNGWTANPVPTRSIAWAFADICKAEYGGKLTDLQLDLQELAELDAVWSSRGDSFNAVFDRKVGIWNALISVAKAGRAAPVFRGGIISIVRDSPDTLVTGMFNMRNILPNTMQIDYVMPSDEITDKIEAEWFEDGSWTQKTEEVELPDAQSSLPAVVKYFGITNREQVVREANYYLNSNRLRRKIAKFETEMEGYIPEYGSLIYVSHDMPAMGQSGEITRVALGPPWRLETSIELEFTPGQTHHLVIRQRNGEPLGPFEVTPYTSLGPNWVEVSDPSDMLDSVNGFIGFDTGEGREKTYFSFGVSNDWSMKAKVTSVRGKRDDLLQISCIEEVDTVHEDGLEQTTSGGLSIQTLILTTDQANFDLFEELGRPTGNAEYRLIIESGVLVYSTSTSSPALLLSGFSSGSSVVLENRGRIIGAGGRGGNAQNLDWKVNRTVGPAILDPDTVISGGTAPEVGGEAIRTTVPLSIDNENGEIFGGGGGGGASDYGYSIRKNVLSLYNDVISVEYFIIGAGGGAGAGSGSGLQNEAQGGMGGRLGIFNRTQSGTPIFGHVIGGVRGGNSNPRDVNVVGGGFTDELIRYVHNVTVRQSGEVHGSFNHIFREDATLISSVASPRPGTGGGPGERGQDGLSISAPPNPPITFEYFAAYQFGTTTVRGALRHPNNNGASGGLAIKIGGSGSVSWISGFNTNQVKGGVAA